MRREEKCLKRRLDIYKRLGEKAVVLERRRVKEEYAEHDVVQDPQPAGIAPAQVGEEKREDPEEDPGSHDRRRDPAGDGD